MSRISQALMFAVLVVSAEQAWAQGITLETALKHVPKSANSLAIVKIQDLLNSPRGKKEDWTKKHQADFMSGAVPFPPTVDFVVRSFEFHPEDTRSTMSFGVAAFKQPITMNQVAAHEKARLEQIAGHTVIQTERNSYFAELAPGLIGGVSPGYRQDVARWLRNANTGTVLELSPYLQEVAEQSQDAQVILALDFQDLIDPKSWRERIKTSSAVSQNANAVALMSKVADSLRGVTLKVYVADKTTATMLLHFNSPVSATAKPFLKPVVIDLLDEAGAALEDLANAEVEAGDKTVALNFGLSDAGMRQIMSLILMPTVSAPEPSSIASSAGTSSANATQATLSASRAYYASIIQNLDDLTALAKKGINYNKTATWHDSFSRKIDQLSIRGVDPDLVAFGIKTSSNLRALAVSLRGVPIQVNQLERAISYNVHVQPEGYYPFNGSIWGSVGYHPGSVNVESNQSEIRARQARAIADGAKEREKVWEMIATDRQQIRVKLLEKFGRDFDTQR